MANFMDQVQYYRDLAKAYSVTMLENIAFYKSMMANQISTIMSATKEYAGQMIANMGKNKELMIAKAKLYYSWAKEMMALGFQKGIAGFQYAFFSALYYCKAFPGWVKNSSIWLYKKFIQGFILGYNLLCKLANLFIDLTSALYNAVLDLAIKTIDALWHVITHFTYYMQKIWNFVTAVANGLKDLTIALMKASWSKIVHAADVLWQGIKNIPAVLNKIGKFVFNIASAFRDAVIGFVDKCVSKFGHMAKAMWLFLQQVPHYLHQIWLVAVKVAVHLRDFAIELVKTSFAKLTQALTTLWQFALNIPHYLSQGWQFVVKIASVIPQYLTQAWHMAVAAVKNMASALLDLASKAINYILPLVKAVAHKAFSKLAMGLGMTFGICAALIDLLFEGLGFIAQHTIGQLLPNLGAIAGILPALKAGLSFGLAGVGAYGVYLGGKKAYNFAKTLFAADAPQPVIAADPVVAQQPVVVANPEVAQPQAQIVPLFNAQRAQADRPLQDAQPIAPEDRTNAKLAAARPF